MTNGTDTPRTREEWLLEVAHLIVPIIEERAQIPVGKFRVSCSFPGSGGLKGNKTRTRGQCWSAELSADKHAEVFISPVEADSREVIQILAHELIHVALPLAGHGKPFQKAARAIGFVAPFTTSQTTPLFWEWADKILNSFPPYPHKELDARSHVGAKKPQKNRQLKCECLKCGYVARTSRKWIEKKGAPHCPDHGQMYFDDPVAGNDLSAAA